MKTPRRLKVLAIVAGSLLLLALGMVVIEVSVGAQLLPDADHLLGRVRLQRSREVPRSPASTMDPPSPFDELPADNRYALPDRGHRARH